MTLMTVVRKSDRFRASSAAAARTAVVLLGILAALPARVEAQCTLSGALKSFEPNPPGPGGPRPIFLSSGFNNNLVVYQPGGNGPHRLLMQESFGYSILELANPVDPRVVLYHDVRFPINGANSIRQAGDGQSFIQTVAVSPDGQRAAFSTTGPTTLNTVAGVPDGNGFILWGDFAPERANGTVIQQTGGRYIAYDVHSNLVAAMDITTLPSGALTLLNMTSETTSWPGGNSATMAGNYLLYMSGGGPTAAIQVVNASNPGPSGNITAAYPRTTITSADFGGRTLAAYTAAVDPADATKLWVLAELNAQAGENSPSYGLLYVTSGLAKVSAGPIWRVPSQTGEVWWANPGPSSALIAGNGGLFVLMWTQRALPSLLFQLYSTSTAAWSSINSAAPPGKFDIPTNIYSNFAPGQPMRGFAGNGNNLYAYLPTNTSAYVIPMSCVSQNAPAVATMSVTNQAGAALNNGDTVFLGDLVTITPSVNPSPSSQPLSGFGWNFDFDFHAGSATDDNGAGTSPRIKAPDNAAFGSGSAPPSLVTVVGPCDYQVPNTSPGSGTGCWNSVTTNAASGGPDFALVPATGSTKALSFAFEANNSLGSAGASLFTLNWKVPQAKLQTTQVLSGAPLASGSDGHPTATGFKWYFGDSPTALTLEPACSGPTCVPTVQANGTHSYWLTASYANGYVTPDYTGTAAMGTYTVTDFAPAFTVNGATSGPLTVVTNQNLTVVNSSQRGATVTTSGGFFYSLCQLPCADNYVLWGSMGDAPPGGSPPTTATIPLPATAGSYALKIRANYTGNGTAYWPDPAGSGYIGLNVVNVQPLVVTATVSPATTAAGQNVTFSCSATGGLQPYSFQWRSPITFTVSTQQTWQTTSPVAGNVVAYCFVTDSQPVPTTSSNQATATFTGGSPISVNVTANPASALINQNITFSCNVSGGTGSYTYQWRSPASSSFVAGTGQSYQTSSPTPTTIQAGCTATDSAGASNSNSRSVSVSTSGGGGSLSVSVSVNPNPATVNQTATFSCNASGGTPPYTYQWRSPAASSFIAGTSQTFQTSSPTPISIQAGCTVFDAVGASTGNLATVQIIEAGPPAAGCIDVDYHLVDDATGLGIPISGNFLGQYFSVQTGQRIRFVATGSTQASWASVAWTFGDGGTATGNDAVYAFAGPGSPTVRVTVDGNATCVKSYLFQVSGPSGIFTARYADNSVFSSTQVESGKALSFVAAAEGADSYAWAFGDGFTATGKSATHAFNVIGTSNVTYTTTLTVTIGAQILTSTQNFTVIAPPEPPKWFVAGLAYTSGAAQGTVWQSDMTLFNPHPTLSGTYSLAFLDGRNPVAPNDLVWSPITLGAQQSISASNVIGGYFAKPLGSYGAVVVRGDVAPVAPTISSRTYNNGDSGRGTFGLSVPPTQASGGVSQQSSAAQQLLIGLRDDAVAYTNIALLNLVANDWSHAHLTFFDALGTNLGVIHVDVPPWSVTQLSKPLTSAGWLGKPASALYRVQVTVDPGGAVYPYATVIDLSSTDPVVITPTEQPLHTYRVPGVVRVAGLNNTVWRSRLTLHNPSTSARQVSLLYSYIPCDATGCAGRQISSGPGDVSIAAGETKTWDDFPAAWLTAVPGGSVSDHVSYGNSFVDVAPAPGDSNLDPLLVLGETFNSQPTGPVGLQLSGFTDFDAGSRTGAGRRLLLTGLASSDEFRTNVAFFLTSGSSGSFNLRVLSDTGVTLKTFGWTLNGSSPFKQFSDSDLFGGVNKSFRMSIVVDSFDGSPVAAYATIIDNKSGDATFVKAQPAP